MRMAQAEFKGAAPGTDRLVKDGTRKQGLANEASGRKYAATKEAIEDPADVLL
ncbi:hypothetical protein VUR80DRAFT_2031 [Thermomyces stellatus]